MSQPQLIEPHVIHTLNHLLMKSHSINETKQYFIYNIGIFVVLFVVIGGVLYFRYKGTLSKKERLKKEQDEYKKVLSLLNHTNNMRIV